MLNDAQRGRNNLNPGDFASVGGSATGTGHMASRRGVLAGHRVRRVVLAGHSRKPSAEMLLLTARRVARFLQAAQGAAGPRPFDPTK